MMRSLKRCGFALSVLGIAACGSGKPVTLDLSTKVTPTGSLPELEPIFSAEETLAVRQGFSWGNYVPVAERDASDRHSLYYVVLYIDQQWQREFLRSVGIHTSFIPLFEEERERWSGQAGFFGLRGDGDGVLAFAIVPGVFLNALGETADAGEPAFTAFAFREPPNPDARNSDGTLSYDFLASEGFLYGGTPTPDPASVESGNSQNQSPLGPTPIVTLRAVVSPIEDAIDEVRAFFGELDALAAGRAEITVSVLPLNTDPAFGVGTPIRRAWGRTTDGSRPWIPTRGEPLFFRNVTVQSHKGASLFRGNAGREGRATFRVAKGEQNLCVELANPAAEVTNFLTALVLCNFNDPMNPDLNLDIQNDQQIIMEVQDYRVNFFAQAQDSYDYLDWVVGRRPRQARIITGFFADIVGEINGGRAFAPCLGNSLDAAAFSLQLTPILGVALPLDVDIVMPFDQGASAASRGVLTHEYGHFALCDIMHQVNAWKYAENWTNVTVNVLGVPGGDNEIAYMNEAFADFFTLQVVGGTNYPTLNGAQAPTVDSVTSPLGYCPPRGAVSRDCAEDNVGGPTENISGAGGYNYNIARAVSLLHDAFDGAASLPDPRLYQTNSGAAWPYDGGANQFGAPDVGDTNDQDESVALPGPAIIDFVRNLFDYVSTLDERNFHNALARTALEYGHTPEEVCEMFTLHAGAMGVPGNGADDYVDCRDMVDADALSFSSIPPSAPTDILVLRSTAAVGDVEFRWSDLSLIAERYDVELMGSPGALTDTVPYARTADYDVTGLAADTAYTFVVTTVNGTSTSSESANFVTFAAAPTSVSASAGPGSVSLTWSVPQPASGFEVWMLAPEERLLSTTTTTSAEVGGLSDAVDYQFAVASLNQVGEASPRVSSNLVRPTTPMVIYVAPDGSDTDPAAGSESVPFQTIAAAVDAAASSSADAVWVLEGAYTETAHIDVTADLDLVGGFQRGTGEWLAGGTTTVNLTAELNTGIAPSTRLFNPSPRMANAGVFVRNGATLVTSDIQWRMSSGINDTRCVMVFYVQGELTMARSDVAFVAPSQGLSSCSAGIGLINAAAQISESTINGMSERSLLSTGADVAGIAAASSSLDVFDSTVVGFQGLSTTSSGNNADLTGITGTSMGSLRISRSTVRAMSPTTVGIPSGQVAALDVTLFSSSANIDNSVFWTPSGAAHNVAVDIGSASSTTPSVTLVHVAAIAGDDWEMTMPLVAGSPRAAVRLAGRFQQFRLVNSALSYAAGARDMGDSTWTALSLSDVLDPFSYVLARGNVFSVPLVTGAVPAFGAANDSLILCVPDEFGQAVDQAATNNVDFYSCLLPGSSTGSWSVANNVALRRLPGGSEMDNPADPHCATFDNTGLPVTAYVNLTTPLSTLTNGGVNLSSLPVLLSSPSDVSGAARDDADVEGIGAWVLP